MNIYDLLFGNSQEEYRRARANEGRAHAAAPIDDAAVAALRGPHDFAVGRLDDGTVVRLAPRDIGRHGIVFGASGAGKSYALHLLMDGFVAAPGHRVELVDPKGESAIVAAEQAAMRYLILADDEREAFAARFRIIDVGEDRVTPANLFAVPAGMSPSLLAQLRAAATVQTSEHDFSDLMAHALFTIYSVAIALQRGITKALTRRFFLDETFRVQVIAPKLADASLRDTVTHLDGILPLSTRQAVVRQFDILLSSRIGRISFGLSPAAVARLTPADERAVITIANCGTSPLVSPEVAQTRAINRVIDVLTEAMVRPAPTPTMFVIEEVASIVSQRIVGRYLLEGSRTARWKGLGIVACSQDPTNALPREVRHALVLNARWLLAFESGREEASLLLPYIGTTGETRTDARRREGFLAEMAALPQQHAYILRKGLSPLKVRIRDLPDPKKRGRSRAELLDVFARHIAARSMVHLDDAERCIAEEERDLLNGGVAPESPNVTRNAEMEKPQTVDELFAILKRGKRGGLP